MTALRETPAISVARRWLPVVIGLLLLAFIFSKTDLAALSSLVRNADPWLLSAAFLTSVANLMLGVVRWRRLLDALSVSVGLLSLTRFVLEAIAINLFIPGGIAGELAKAFNLHQEHADGGPAYSSVITDKLVGLFAFLLLALLALLVEWQSLGTKNVLLPVSIVGLALVFGSAVLYSGRLSRVLSGVLQHIPFLYRIWVPLSASLLRYRRMPAVLSQALMIGLAAHVLQIVCTWLIGLSLGVELGLASYLFYVPVIALVAALPISNSGIGLRESAFVLLLATAGVSNEAALAISLIFTSFALLLPGLAGIICFIFSRRSPSK